MLADLARGLAERGHTVHLAAAEGSHVTGTAPVDLGVDANTMAPARFGGESARTDEAAQRDAFARVRRWIDEHPDVEIVHAHAYDAPAFEALAGASARVFHTLHLPPLDHAVVEAAMRAEDARQVTVSRANAAAWERAGLHIHAIIPNGIDVSRVPFGTGAGRYLACAGRIAPEKGTDVAIRAAAAARLPLLIVGGVYDTAYFESCVRPHVRQADWEPSAEGATYVGARPRAEVHRILAGATATLMPVRWEEPFGLVALESLAAGTPVVAFARGGLTELIDDSCGALVQADDEEAFTTGVRQALGADRQACRRRAERFSLTRMVDAYEEVLAG
jgi:glycosyltransferase involved in cell wall biosynthesis